MYCFTPSFSVSLTECIVRDLMSSLPWKVLIPRYFFTHPLVKRVGCLKIVNTYFILRLCRLSSTID